MQAGETVLRYMMDGNCCAQAVVRLGLAMRGEENEQLVQASAGLCGGMRSGCNCGALTGGCLMLSLFGTQASRELIPSLTEWFDDAFGMRYGSINCEDIMQNDPRYRLERCRPLTMAVGEKCVDLLLEKGYWKEEV